MSEERQTPDVLYTSTNLAGAKRIIQLYPGIHHEADVFIPLEDKLNLLLFFSITESERSRSHPLKALRKTLVPKISGLTNCKIDYRLDVAENRNWFIVEYHVYDYQYGLWLYNELKKQLFTPLAKPAPEVLLTSATLAGIERLIQLYPGVQHEADAFIPPEDELNLLLRFSITKLERNHSKPIRALKQALEPKVGNLINCNVRYRFDVDGHRNWFVIEYHIYNYEYGIGLYNKLKHLLFTTECD